MRTKTVNLFRVISSFLLVTGNISVRNHAHSIVCLNTTSVIMKVLRTSVWQV